MRRTFFLIGLLVELIAVFLIFLPNFILMTTGTLVTLKTIPVDPRSIFRGDYVVLTYEIGQKYDGPVPSGTDYYSMPVYAVLENKEGVFVAKDFVAERPTLLPGQACLVGMAQNEYRWNGNGNDLIMKTVNFPDIQQFFVTEGLGKELEQARNAHKLYVDVVTDTSCHAVIRGVRIAEEAALLPTEGVPGEKIPPVEVR